MPKSSKSRQSSRASGPSSGYLPNPLTPLRRFFFKLEFLGSSPSAPTTFLGKRSRENELPEREAGFEHLHAYDHGTAVEKVLDNRLESTDRCSAIPINVYASDGSRKWTQKPAGPRSRRQVSASPSHHATRASRLTPSHPYYPTPRSPQNARKGRTARLALQNIDASLGDDAVIITTLDTIPFNRHEDLLAMSRNELVNVARELNAKLPQALSIDTSDDRPLTFIRDAIEVLVGIRPEAPAAPLCNGRKEAPQDDRPRFFEEFSFERRLDEIENYSPLPLRAQPGDWSGRLHDVLRVPRQLERLEEETEESLQREDSYGRKRRRLSSGTETSRQTDSDIVMHTASEDSLDRRDEPVSHPNMGKPGVTTSPPPMPRVLRSHNRNLQAKKLDSAPPLPKRVLSPKRKLRIRSRRNHQASPGSSGSSTNQQRNSIAFPAIKSSSTGIRHQSSSESHELDHSGETTSSIGINSSDDTISSGTTKSSARSGKRSSGDTDSLFLSIKSTFSSASKMSVCTRNS